MAGLTSFAQTDSLREKIDSIFEHVDKSQIPTGYLKEYGTEFLPLHLYNGILTDSNRVNDADILRTAYADLYTAKIQSSLQPMISLPALNDLIDTARRHLNSTVAILYGQYASIKHTALDENLFTVSGEQLYDVPQRSTTPYITNNLFVAAVTNLKFRNTVTLSFDSSFYFTNTGISLTSLSIDFMDGNGYQLITSTGISKTYTDSTGSKEVVFKAVLSNSAIMYCHGTLFVKVTQDVASRYTNLYSAEIPISTLTTTSGIYNDIQDKLQIRYSVLNPTRNNPTPLVRKPLIYVEGYDVTGDYDVYDLIRNNSSDPQKGEWVNLFTISGYDFMNDLDDVSGYDLIFVNYNTLRSIPDNALMLQQVIQWVNGQKAAAGSTEKNVVLGVSAGGLVARYCLANMTKNIGYNSTDTKVLITHDSPHRGANVPLALQYFLYDLAYTTVLGIQVRNTQAALNDFILLNNQPATAQLLRARAYHYQQVAGYIFGQPFYEDMVGTSMNTFLSGASSQYQQMINLPANQRPYKFIATAQGSQCGVPVINESNVTIASQDAVFTKIRVPIPIWFGKKYWLKTSLKTLPSIGIAGIEDYQMQARTSIFGIGFGWKTVREVHRNNPDGFTGWDAVPGSTQSIASRSGNALTGGLMPIRGEAPLPEPFVIIDGGLSLQVFHDLFSFVSTTSALDVPDGTSPFTPFNYAMYGASNTGVDKYIAQNYLQYYNLNHTDYTARNAKWIYNEMENNTNGFGCEDQCPSNSGYAISGPNLICTSGTYTLSNVGPGAIVNWSISQNSNLVSLTTSSNIATLQFTNVGSGYVTLYATPKIINCNNAPPPISKLIYVGVPQSVTGASGIPIIVHCSITGTNLLAVNGGGATSFKWYTDYPSSPGYVLRRTANPVRDTWLTSPNDCAEIGTLKIDAINACGTNSTPYIQQIGGECYPITIEDCQARGAVPVDSIMLNASPNPAKDLVTVELKYSDNRRVAMTGRASVLIKKLMLVNNIGNPVIILSGRGTSKRQFNIGRLTTGSYRLSVFNGERWISAILIKE